MRKEFIAHRSTAETLLKLESELVKIASGFHLSLKETSSQNIPFLNEIEPIRFHTICHNLENLKKIFFTCESTQTDPWDDQKFLSLSMKALGLSFPQDFLTGSTTEDLVEGYDLDRFQVFRNMRFMETSMYSLVEIQSYEWPALFDRASLITNQIIKYCDQILWDNNKTLPVDIAEHYIKEMRTEDQQILAVKFKNICPTFAGPNRPYGFLISCNARIVEANAKDSNLSFV